MTNVAMPVRMPASQSGIPSSRLKPIAAPRNSARSVAMATISINAHIVQTAPGWNRSRQCSARFLPVAMPSLAERLWSSMAIRLLASTTQSSRYPYCAPAWMLVA